MNHIRKKSWVGLCLISLTSAGFLWLQAQENESAESGDKWAQIKKNNEEIQKSLENIEENLNFVKARSMRGGRGS